MNAFVSTHKMNLDKIVSQIQASDIKLQKKRRQERDRERGQYIEIRRKKEGEREDTVHRDKKKERGRERGDST